MKYIDQILSDSMTNQELWTLRCDAIAELNFNNHQGELEPSVIRAFAAGYVKGNLAAENREEINKSHPESFREFMEAFMFLQRFNCIEAIDAMFAKMIKEEWSTESLTTNKLLIVTFCRTNFRFKDRITNYQAFLDKSVKYLNDNNIKPENVLQGILP